jgi:LEA14-like dessication related protein
MTQTKLSRGLGLLLLLGACTPVGLWLYRDPVVTVSRITLQLDTSQPSGLSPLIVALAVENPNDYPLSTEQVEVSLRLDGVPMGRLQRDSAVSVVMDSSSTVSLALSLEQEATRDHLKALSTGTHKFAVRGRATFQTPIGKRKVRFAQEGDMEFGERQSESTP